MVSNNEKDAKERQDKLKTLFRMKENRNTSIVNKMYQASSQGVLEANNILVIGDLHLEYDYRGSHIDYAENCRRIMKSIYKKVVDSKVDLLILAGDIFGVKQGVGFIKNRDFLSEVIDWLLSLQNLNCLVVGLRGNHDMYQPNDFDFLSKYLYFLNSELIKDRTLVVNPRGHEVSYKFKFSFVPYGKENENLNLTSSDDYSNIVIAHNNFQVRGKESMYAKGDYIELNTHLPFYNADLILAGDIHLPSEEILDFTFTNGHSSYFLSLGCPTRPSSSPVYQAVWAVELRYEGTEPSLMLSQLALPDWDETFVKSTDENSIEDYSSISTELENRKEALEAVLSSIGTIESSRNSYFRTIDALASVSDEVKSMAKDYISRAVTTEGQ